MCLKLVINLGLSFSVTKATFLHFHDLGIEEVDKKVSNSIKNANNDIIPERLIKLKLNSSELKLLLDART